MVTFLTICGVLFTVAFFLYALSAVDNQSLNKKEKERLKKEENLRVGDPRKVYGKEKDPNLPRLRLCPVCGTVLRKDEYLYAAISTYTNSEGKKQAQIYGCKYCYLILDSEKNSSEQSQGKENPFGPPKPTDEI
ncbi:MAG: hypothetical protein ACO1NV_05675 [Leptospira bouyouniensis]|uniref:hypothetical protein n=1 Tax=Leptospira bouyouniensis TaxID=2484911 RepID=UPI0010918140|nr:hypothetical protein [Leptospira bouyouniensis]TGM79445.1 hypothetical protein EHQ99_06715 [Leptospira bouyouniensis]